MSVTLLLLFTIGTVCAGFVLCGVIHIIEVLINRKKNYWGV